MTGHNKYVSFADVKRERPKFLYEPFLPEGVISLMAGEAGIGKSTLALRWVALATRGQLPGDYQGRPVTVLVYEQEDSDGLLKSRLEAMGADLNRVIPICKVETVDGEEIREPYTLPEDNRLLEQAATDNSAAMLVIDPITALVSGDSNKRDDVRRSLDPLAALAMRCNMTILGLQHFSKGQGRASEKVSGSHAFRDLCRSMILVARDDRTGEHVATVDKSNYSRAQGTSYGFTLENRDLTDDNGETEHVGVIGMWRESDTSVNDITSRNHGEGSPTKGADCERDMLDYLQAHGGSASKSDVVAAMREQEWSKYQTQHAQQNSTRIVSERNGYQSEATWSLNALKKMANMANVRNSNDSGHASLASLANMGDSNGLVSTQTGQPTFDAITPTETRTGLPQANQTSQMTANMANVRSSNVSGTSKPQSSQSSQSNGGVDGEPSDDHDVTAFLNGLPEFVSQVDYASLEPWQLEAIRSKHGAWESKAEDEQKRRAAK